MHKRFDHQAIEKKWQENWKESGIYDVGQRDKSKEKEYVLVEWPYPSGNLHIGHWYAFAVPDIYVRYRRMTGKQVLYPMGFDAFGLPAENAAIKRNINPREWTEQNIEYMKGQLGSMGNAFSWDKTTSSTDPEYYKWTQWMFGEFFKNNIAYRGEGIVNWCPGCNTVIANEQVQSDSTCERCDSLIEKKRMPQWMIRITDFADELLDGLETVDWPEHIKEAQRQWIGRSKGAEIDFELSVGEKVTVFTTRPDTLFGATYLVLAPEHAYVEKYKDQITNWDEVATYVQTAKQKSEIERGDNTKEKTGVKLEGITAKNPANGEEIPVYIADYVLGGYGTGAIMAVPAHDERDNAFARKFGLVVRPVVAELIHDPREGVETLERGHVVDLIIEHPTDGTFLLQREKDTDGPDHVHFVGGGTEGERHIVAIQRELEEETGFTNFNIVNSAVHVVDAHLYRHTKQKNQHTESYFYHVKLTSLEQIPSEIEEGKHTIEWVSRDEIENKITWSGHLAGWRAFEGTALHTSAGKLVNSNEFNGMNSEEAKAAITEKVGGRMTNTYRLRDWSIGRQRYWGVPIPIVYDPEGKAHAIPKEHLPWILPEDVDFTPTGVPPLSKSVELKERTERIFGVGFTPEVETMDTFVDSSWYFLRYIDNHNQEGISSKEAQQDWMQVDMYFGGAEHTTMHLLYSRFWQRALKRLGLAQHAEPYKMRINRGLILGPDGNKMSKSKGNVVDPDEQVQLVGADTVKMYLAFMGPYQGANYPWDLGGIAGLRRFLERVNGLSAHITGEEPKETLSLLHKTIKKVGSDITEFKFNTGVSAMMIFVNQAEKAGLSKESYELFLRILAPFAPHLTEELWYEAGNSCSIHTAEFPAFDANLAKDELVTIGVQINGKMRGTISIAPEADEATAMETLKNSEELQTRITGQTIKKVIYVPGRILNIIASE
jgi:leucyl-tRNA synthetase